MLGRQTRIVLLLFGKIVSPCLLCSLFNANNGQIEGHMKDKNNQLLRQHCWRAISCEESEKNASYTVDTLSILNIKCKNLNIGLKDWNMLFIHMSMQISQEATIFNEIFIYWFNYVLYLQFPPPEVGETLESAVCNSVILCCCCFSTTDCIKYVHLTKILTASSWKIS